MDVSGYYQECIQNISTFLKKNAEEIKAQIAAIKEEGEKSLLNGLENADVWGDYGWTFSPEASKEPYMSVPASLEAADQFMESYLESIDFFAVIQEIKASSFVSSEDVYEAETLYKQGIYKSCAMMLFSIIDGLVIQLQPAAVGDSSRKNGEKGFNFVKDSANIDEATFKYLLFSTSEKAFKALWKYCRDYNGAETDMINRNLVMHGMYMRKVTKADCEKLFLLYDNLLYCFDLL